MTGDIVKRAFSLDLRRARNERHSPYPIPSRESEHTRFRADLRGHDRRSRRYFRSLSQAHQVNQPNPTKTHMKITIEQAVEIENANLLAASIQDEIRQAKDQAADMGERAGKNAAEWVAQDTWGGRATRGEKEAAREFLRAFDDCELDLTPPNLSGEWADSETPASLMCAVFGDNWEETPEFVDAQDEICAAWEIAAQDAFYSTLCHSAQSILE